MIGEKEMIGGLEFGVGEGGFRPIEEESERGWLPAREGGKKEREEVRVAALLRSTKGKKAMVEKEG